MLAGDAGPRFTSTPHTYRVKRVRYGFQEEQNVFPPHTRFRLARHKGEVDNLIEVLAMENKISPRNVQNIRSEQAYIGRKYDNESSMMSLCGRSFGDRYNGNDNIHTILLQMNVCKNIEL